MPLIAIAALDPDRVIGRNGTLPWYLPEDLKLFKRITLGHPIIMGRRTWESLPIKPLPGRHNIVFSKSLAHPGITVLGNPKQLAAEIGDRECFLIGGAALYTTLLPFCDALILTHVHQRHPGDVYFPDYAGIFRAGDVLAETADFQTVRYHNTRPLPLPEPVATVS